MPSTPAARPRSSTASVRAAIRTLIWSSGPHPQAFLVERAEPITPRPILRYSGGFGAGKYSRTSFTCVTVTVFVAAGAGFSHTGFSTGGQKAGGAVSTGAGAKSAAEGGAFFLALSFLGLQTLTMRHSPWGVPPASAAPTVRQSAPMREN